jgi:hypothetical protein
MWRSLVAVVEKVGGRRKEEEVVEVAACSVYFGKRSRAFGSYL